MEMQGMGAGLLEDAAEVETSRRVPIPTQNSPKSCLDLEQEDFGAQQVPDPLCAHHPTACQLLRFSCLKAWEEISQGNLEQGQCLPKPQQTSQMMFVTIFGTNSQHPAPQGTQTAPRGLNGTWSPLMIVVHSESNTEE